MKIEREGSAVKLRYSLSKSYFYFENNNFFNCQGMGYSYKKIFRTPYAETRSFQVENKTKDNDLGVTAKYLELIYESYQK